jgi:hypothetical protein
MNQTNQTTTANASAAALPLAFRCGRVFNDINQNGKKDFGSEPGIQGFTVRLAPASDEAFLEHDISTSGSVMGSFCVSGYRDHIMGKDVSFKVTAIPPEVRLPDVEPPSEEADIVEPLDFEATTQQPVTVTFKKDDISIPEQQILFGFRQVPCIPEVTRCP